MKERKPKKSKPGMSKPVTAPLIQVLPEQRVRIDPSAVPDLCCYLYALSRQWDRAARQTLRSLKGPARSRAKGHIKWAKMMVAVTEKLINALFHTVHREDYYTARSEWTRFLDDAPEEGDPWQSPARSGEQSSNPPSDTSAQTHRGPAGAEHSPPSPPTTTSSHG